MKSEKEEALELIREMGEGLSSFFDETVDLMREYDAVHGIGLKDLISVLQKLPEADRQTLVIVAAASMKSPASLVKAAAWLEGTPVIRASAAFTVFCRGLISMLYDRKDKEDKQENEAH